MEHVFIVKVIDSHRITIPHTICDLLGIHPGDFVKVTLKKLDKEEL